MTWKWFVRRSRKGVWPEVETQGDIAYRGAVSQKRQIETSAVPGGDHAGVEFCDGAIQADENVGLLAVKDVGPPIARNCNGDDWGRCRIEPTELGVGFDIERVDDFGVRAGVADERTLAGRPDTESVANR